jgi:hypothetical protein
VRPIPETGPGLSSGTGQAARRLCLALHRMGFIVPRRLPSGRWAFTPPFHPCRAAHSSAPRRSVFCDTFHRPGLAPRPSAGLSAACCLVVFGLSSPAEAGATIYPRQSIAQEGPRPKPKMSTVTPAMEAGVADHVWSLEEIVGLLP